MLNNTIAMKFCVINNNNICFAWHLKCCESLHSLNLFDFPMRWRAEWSQLSRQANRGMETLRNFALRYTITNTSRKQWGSNPDSVAPESELKCGPLCFSRRVHRVYQDHFNLPKPWWSLTHTVLHFCLHQATQLAAGFGFPCELGDFLPGK